MRPFYRMLTYTALVLQSVIIIYLLCLHHRDHVPRGTESCQSNHPSRQPDLSFRHAVKAERKDP